MERICLDKRQSNTFSNGLEGADGLPHNREGDADAEDAGSAFGLQSSTSTGEKYSSDQTWTPFRFTVHPSIVSGISKKWKNSSLHP